MAENLIFAEQELAFASVEELGGAYAHDFESGNQFTMAVGQTYRIVWDGEPWDAVAWDASAYVDDTIGVGNAALLGLSGTNEPFLIAWSPNGTVIVSYDAEASHRIAIYQVVEEETFLVVKKSSMKSVADSIRVKAGVEGDLEWPAGYKAAIEGITGSGASAEDVRYVTFMSDDGTEELGKIPVATGYDCPTPKFTATKESTAQFHFTHDYWATEPNGATDRNALKAVTEDRVVYATYISVLRSYTITYYDEDGATVLNAETLAYGTIPSYKPEKDGFNFDSWEPAIAAVTGDTSYYAKWIEEIVFATAPWATIARISEAGEAKNYFALGEKKEFTYTNPYDGKTYTTNAVIVDFDHDDLADGSGKAGITLAIENVHAYTRMNATTKTFFQGTGYSCGGYSQSDFRKVTAGEIMASMDEGLQNAIKLVTKKHGSGYRKDGEKTVASGEAYIFIPCAAEIGMSLDSNYAAASEEGTRYPGIRYLSIEFINGLGAMYTRSSPINNVSAWRTYVRSQTFVTTANGNNPAGLFFLFCI